MISYHCKRLICLFVASFFLTGVLAKVKLPAVFSDGMVLQQQASVPVWGTSSGQTVYVTTSWNEKKYRVQVNDDGAWRVMVITPKAGGPYEIYLNDGNEMVLRDVLIGEVWLASGQSNMGMRVASPLTQPVLHADRLISEAGNPLIRLFRLPVKQAVHPLDDCDATWTQPDSASVSAFSAVAYQFALNLQRELGVPVGILQSAYGGTQVQAWMDSTSLNSFPELAGLGIPEKVTKNTPTVLFNAMIYPILGYRIKGAIWYQGEGNRGTADRYADWFAAMVQGWREKWNQGNFPFLYAQIAPFKYDGKNQSAYLREAQLQAMTEIPNTGMAVTLDIGSKKTIHPPDKTTVAGRLSNLALAKVYGKLSAETNSPVLKKTKRKGNNIHLYFNNVAEGLVMRDSETANDNFEVAGADRQFYPATVRIVADNELIVQSSRVTHPIAVRYCFKDWTVGSLFNSVGLPASSFRTDNGFINNINEQK